MEMTYAWWNIPDSFSTSSLRCESPQSAFTRMSCCGANCQAHLTPHPWYCVCSAVSGECRCFATLHLDARRCSNVSAASLTDMFFLPDEIGSAESASHLELMWVWCFCWPADGEVLWTFWDPPPSHPQPSPSLCLPHVAPHERSSCTNFIPLHIVRTHVGDLPQTEHRERRETKPSDCFLSCWITSLKSGSSCAHISVSKYMKVRAVSVCVDVIVTSCRHGCILCCDISSPGLSAFLSSALPPSCLGRNGLLLRRRGRPEPLHAQVRKHRLQSHRGGIKRVRLPSWGLLHADRLDALVPLLWRAGARAEPQCQPADRLQQERGTHMVAEPVHVLWRPAPQFCQSHPPPG